ncbi:WXG100 family type VII secretion target [Nocardia sp. NPDC060259]|uniref:WXG100 family type VII secretion target n=1 Tax=Nocardia sp. NPDC060259 TaxID=3347088 RepID=UPI00365215B2
MADLGAIRYEFGAINDSGTGLKKAAEDITTALQDYENEFQRFIEANWSEGAGSTAFAVIQSKWQGDAIQLNTALAAIGTKTLSGAENMKAMDGQLAKMLEG